MIESERPSRSIPLQTCAACGSTWFREATFYQRQDSSAGETPTTLMLQTILVCLCGAPVPPRLGGGRGGWTPNLELSQFLKSLKRAQKVLDECRREEVKQQAAKPAARREQVQALDTALAKVEWTLGQLQAGNTAARKSPGRTWRSPGPKVPRSGRAYLAWELQKRGFTFREARRVVSAIFESIQEELQRGAVVETLFGQFRVVGRPVPRTRWRLGRIEWLYRRRKKVVFKAAEGLR
jgi:nucleoid DNA-binding protein